AGEGWIDTTTASGRMLLNVLVSASQWEREAIAERTREVLRYKREQGQVYGRTPYGYEVAGKPRAGKKLAGMRLVPVPREQKVIQRIRRMRAAGVTLMAIAGRLNR